MNQQFKIQNLINMLLLLGMALLLIFYQNRMQSIHSDMTNILAQGFHDAESVQQIIKPLQQQLQELLSQLQLYLLLLIITMGVNIVVIWLKRPTAQALTQSSSPQSEAATAAQYFDPLTGLYSRSVLGDLISHELARTKRAQTNATVLLIGIDQLATLRKTNTKIANHACHEIGQTLKNTSRRGDYVFYMGEGRFLVYLSDCKERYTINAAERFRTAVESTKYQYNDQPLPLTVSVGIAASTSIYVIDELKIMAESALQQASASGNCSVLHSPE